uniref:Uncharacterized protein n=1 Tax=Picea glauca TaxID=3330 RepID=A0A117NIZ8_PICGL|nr:hypothetical protein ABT39_MTgene582 [Picea glauca]QHR87549.1 hypothetical protein Q903MT_gene1560 [Picea sitchensis]
MCSNVFPSINRLCSFLTNVFSLIPVRVFSRSIINAECVLPPSLPSMYSLPPADYHVLPFSFQYVCSLPYVPCGSVLSGYVIGLSPLET